MFLVVAFALRAWQLTAVPPGLTHDEAAHGHDAAHILKGVAPIYFTVGYGREPLFDYVNAGLVIGLGAAPFTLRFAAICWGTLALASTYRAARLAFDRRTALLALALMAVSFWPLTTSRQALRSAMLPGEMALAVSLFLQLQKITTERAENAEKKKWLLVIGLGLVLAASLYTYIPARALWLIFPLTAFLAARKGMNREGAKKDYLLSLLLDVLRFIKHAIRNTQYVLLSLFLALALASPLFIYLFQHPEAEQRIAMLSEPLTALQNGDPSRFFANARETLLAFFLPGHGDHFLAYTIPGKPLFDPVTFLLFLAGLLIIIFSILRHPITLSPRHLITPSPSLLVSVLLLLWLGLGLAPAFVTGPEALTTRIIGTQPILYILPALALSRLTELIGGQHIVHRPSSVVIVSLFIVSLLISTVRDYFFIWSQSPDVRAAYQSTLIAALKTVDGPTVLSTVYPSAPHDPYIAELITSHETRWVDARLALLIPANSDFKLIVPASTPPHPEFARLVQPLQTIPLRPNDLDPFFTFYRLNILPSPEICCFISGEGGRRGEVNFGDAIQLLDSHWSADSYHPGDMAEMTTVWRVTDPARLGPMHPPTFKTDLNLFTHTLNSDGTILLQRDSLEAPSWDWKTGDIILQIHQLAIPGNAPPGEYVDQEAVNAALAHVYAPWLRDAAELFQQRVKDAPLPGRESRRLDDVPPGWRDDEVLETTVHARLVIEGERPLYFIQAEGHEPLYHYISALWVWLAGDSLFSVRLVSVFFGLLTVVATYRLSRQLFGGRFALFVALLLAVSFWALMYSRVKIRHIGELPFALLAFSFLFTSVRRPSPSALQLSASALAGFFLALALYTYLAATSLFIIVFGFGICLALTRQHWRPVAIAFAISAALYLPLASAIAGRAERVSVVGGPLTALRAGDPQPFFQNVLATAAMFGNTGDPEALYNIPGRPVFNLIGFYFFVGGLIICLWRWRDPRYAFLLIWLAGGLAPAFASTPPASLGHSITILPAVYILAALPVIEFSSPNRLRLALPLLLFLGVAGRDLPDYFWRWPRLPEVRYLYKAELHEAARQFRDALPATYVLSGPLSIWDRRAFALEGVAFDSPPRWVNSEWAIVFPSGAESAYYLFPLAVWQKDTPPQNPASIQFANDLTLEGWDGQGAVVVAHWRVGPTFELAEPSIGSSVASPQFPVFAFAHLLNADGSFAAGAYRFDADAFSLQPGDRYLQRHVFEVAPGVYTLEIGLYNPITDERILTVDGRNTVLLGTLTIP
ncbi:MAG: glycosyltransferase family 39 protein [Chloroflexi bacterium]|nr:glycosyltransferase family 39 protein [Chloroflexota bacterium]